MDKEKDMEKKKTTFFCKRIGELQRLRGYSTNYVLENLLYDDGEPVINNQQVLDKYKSGARAPQNFEDAVKAFAKFYDVSTDYLLGADDIPNRQIQSVREFTGLSEDALRGLVELKNTYPDILAMVDAIVACASTEHVTLLYTLYQQIYEDYVDDKLKVKGSENYPIRMQQRGFFMQNFFQNLQYVVTAKLAPYFERNMLEDEERLEYRNSPEYIQSIIDFNEEMHTFLQDNSDSE